MKLEGLIHRVEGYLPGAEVALLRNAYAFSAERHLNQKRASGEPYVSHPLAVAGLVADLRLDIPSIATALLHDTVEDTLTTLGHIEKEFGSEVAGLVDGVTKIGRINFTSREEHQAENFRKMILAMSRDIRIILIKLADRTHNMRTLDGLAVGRQEKVAQETLDIYAPLAHRLGISWMKIEMEDHALRTLHPEIYHQLKRMVAKKKGERERYIRTVQAALKKKVDESGIEAEVAGRPKHFYSIYEKMRKQNLLYEQVFDLVAFRIVVYSFRECYETLGVIHANWTPVPGRFKDYIALPKANGYQSLHTTVVGPDGQRIEIQIRTRDMHRIAEDGVAAHWQYKTGQGSEIADVQRFAWLRQMVEWQNQVRDPHDFLHGLKENLFGEEVWVFTPKGELLHFPQGSSIIDFAYRIHSEVGHHCTGARIGGRLVPLRHSLQNGDTVEIITTRRQAPSRDWLKFVVTPRAKERIRIWLRTQQSARSEEVGRALLERDLARHGLDFAKLESDGTLARVAAELGATDVTSLIAEIGYGRRMAGEVLARLAVVPEVPAESAASRLQQLLGMVGRRATADGVRVSGLSDVLVRFARCCDPLPGEDVVGFVSRGRGVTVHGMDCARGLEAGPLRRVDCVWDGGAETARPVRLEVLVANEQGQLAAISRVLAQAGIDIRKAEARTVADDKALFTFEILVHHIDELRRVRRNLTKLKSVVRVDRLKVRDRPG